MNCYLLDLDNGDLRLHYLILSICVSLIFAIIKIGKCGNIQLLTSGRKKRYPV